MTIRSFGRTALLGLCAFSLTSVGCKKDEPAPAPPPPVVNRATPAAPATPATPAPSAADAGIKTKAEDALKKAGFTGVTVTVAGGEITATGNVPKGKLQDAVKALNEAGATKVNNKIMEQ